MAVQFNIDSHFNEDARYKKVLFGYDGQLLEVELNEMQDIMNARLAEVIDNVFGTRPLYAGTYSVSGSVLTITNEVVIANRELILLTSSSITVSPGDTIYLNVQTATKAYTDSIKQYGDQGSNTTVTNYIEDSRAGEETTRRIQVTYQLVKNTSNPGTNVQLCTIDSNGNVVKGNPDSFADSNLYKEIRRLANEMDSFSNISVGGTTIMANQGMDTFTIAGSGAITAAANASTKTVTIGANAASTSQAGVVQLTDGYQSTSTTTAATANAVNAAYNAAVNWAKGFGLGTTEATTATDLNTLTTASGFYYAGSSTANKPGSNNGHVLVMVASSTYIYQQFTDMATGVIYTRVNSAGTWSAWATLATTAVATESANGLMSSTDKTKLDGLNQGTSSSSTPTFAGLTLTGDMSMTSSNGHIKAASAGNIGFTNSGATAWGLRVSDNASPGAYTLNNTLDDGTGRATFAGVVTAPTFTSNVAQGTAPFTVASTTQVANLNAQYVNGYSFDQSVKTTDSVTHGGLTISGTSNFNGGVYNRGTQYITPTATATSSSNYGSYGVQLQSSTWNGTAAVTNGRSLWIDGSNNVNVSNTSGASVTSIDNSGNISANTMKSTVATGTAPFTVTSTTKVTNLNADMVDGYNFNQSLQTTDSPTFAKVTGSTLVSTVATGTAPFTVTSTTQVANLNAQYVNGYSFNQALQTTNSPTFSALTLNVASGTAPLTVTSTTKVTNLNVDMVDGYHLNQGVQSTDQPTFNGAKLTNSLTLDAGGTTNMGIEIGSTSGASTPFMDFHSSGANNDYDARIIASGGTSGTSGKGTLAFYAGTIATNNVTLDDGSGNLSTSGYYKGNYFLGSTTNTHVVPASGGNVGFTNNAQSAWGLRITDGATPAAYTIQNTLDDGSGNMTVAGSTTLNGALTANSTIQSNPDATATSTNTSYSSRIHRFMNSSWNGSAAVSNYRDFYMDGSGNFVFTNMLSSGNTSGVTTISTGGDIVTNGNVQAGGKFLAAEGSGTAGGYSFTNDGSQDTGMFSQSDGNLNFYANGVSVIGLNNSTVTIAKSTTIQGNTYVGAAGSASNNLYIGNASPSANSTKWTQLLPGGATIQGVNGNLLSIADASNAWLVAFGVGGDLGLYGGLYTGGVGTFGGNITANGGTMNVNGSGDTIMQIKGHGAVGSFPGWNANFLYINTYSNGGTETASFSGGVKIKGALITDHQTLDDGSGNSTFAGNVSVASISKNGASDLYIVPSSGKQVGFVNNAQTAWGLRISDSTNPATYSNKNTLDDGNGNMTVGGLTANGAFYANGSASFSGNTNLMAKGTASSSANFASNLLAFGSSTWNGSAAVSNWRNLWMDSTNKVILANTSGANSFTVDNGGNGWFGGSLTSKVNTLDDGSGNATIAALSVTNNISAKTLTFTGASATSFDTYGNVTAVGSSASTWNVIDKNSTAVFYVNVNGAKTINTANYQLDDGTGNLTKNTAPFKFIATGTGNYTVIQSASDKVYLQTPTTMGVYCVAPNTTSTMSPLYCSAVNPASREEWKTNIVEAGSGLEVLSRATVYEYNLKAELEEGVTKTRHGLVIGKGWNTPSEVVDHSGDAIDMYSLTSINTKAIQELKEENDSLKAELKAENDSLKAENDSLKAELSEVKAQLAAIMAKLGM